MNALADLRRQLAEVGLAGDRPLPVGAQIDRLIAALQQQGRHHRAPTLAADAVPQAVRSFRQTLRLTSLAQAQQVSYGLCLPYSAGPASLGGAATCLLEDTACFDALLQATSLWRDKPASYRRCFQGLLHGYFGYDPGDPAAPPAGRANWARLRGHLREGFGAGLLARSQEGSQDGSKQGSQDRSLDPAWVASLRDHPQLLTETPCARFAQDALRGDFTEVETLCARLGIGQASWFVRELVWAQVRAAEALPDGTFDAAVATLLPRLETQPLLRDRGLACLLDRDARRSPDVTDTPATAVHPNPRLRDTAMVAWGAPWLGANDLHWQRVSSAARARLTNAIGGRCIEMFFGRWARDDAGASRRATFWRQYLPSIRKLHCVLGRRHAAEVQRDASLCALARADGLVLDAAEPDAAALPALLLVMGGVVVVEFADGRVPVRVYSVADASGGPEGAATVGPIDLARPLHMRPDAANSLQSNAVQLCMAHLDGQRGWRTWESWFEAALWQQFGLAPGAPGDGPGRRQIDLADPPRQPEDAAATAAQRSPSGAVGLEPSPPVADQDVHWRTAEASIVPFSRADLAVFARIHGLQLDDQQAEGGKLWVRTGPGDARLALVLRRWGFDYAQQQGWWK